MGAHKHFDSEGEEEASPPTSINPSSSTLGPAKQAFKPAYQNKLKRKGRNQKSLRIQIRSVERLIKNRGSHLAPVALKKKQEELKELIRLRDEHDRREKERNVAKKYRMVKFFETRKLERTLDKIFEHGDKPEDAEQKKQILRDLRYINNYPKDKKYVALFPSGGHTERSRQKLDTIRAKIEGNAGGETKTDDSKRTTAEREDKHRNEGDVGQSEKDDFFLDADDE